MLSKELMNLHQVLKVWSCVKKEESIAIGYVRAYLCECKGEKWMVVITDSTWEPSEILHMNTRATAMKRIRDRGFWTRVSKTYPRILKK